MKQARDFFISAGCAGVRVGQEGLATEYQGRTYYFDSKEHVQMFEQDPERYLQMAKEKGWAA